MHLRTIYRVVTVFKKHLPKPKMYMYALHINRKLSPNKFETGNHGGFTPRLFCFDYEYIVIKKLQSVIYCRIVQFFRSFKSLNRTS